MGELRATDGAERTGLGVADDRARGGDRRRRAHRADAGRGAGAGRRRRRGRGATGEPGGRRIARRRAPRPLHRGARPARHRRAVPRRRPVIPARVRRDPLRHQRPPDPPHLRAGAVAEPLRADPGRLGRASSRSRSCGARGGGACPGRHRRRRRAVRRHLAPGGVPRGLRRRAQPGPQGGRHRLRRAGPLDQLDDRRGRDGRGAGARAPPRPRRHPRARSGADGTAVRVADHGAARRRTTASRPWTSSARRSSACGGRTSGCAGPAGSPGSPTCPGRRRPTATAGCCSPATPPTCTRRRAARASTPACRTR